MAPMAANLVDWFRESNLAPTGVNIRSFKRSESKPLHRYKISFCVRGNRSIVSGKE